MVAERLGWWLAWLAWPRMAAELEQERHCVEAAVLACSTGLVVCRSTTIR